jgi:hypothetical protein
MNEKNTMPVALDFLKSILSRGFVDGGYDWNKEWIEATLKHRGPSEDPLADDEVQHALADWQAQGLIKLTGKDRPYLRVLKSLLPNQPST